jgi:MFS family permease
MMDKKNNSFSRFMILWAGQLLSGLGNGMTAFALGVYVYNKTGSATGFAMVVLSLFLPSILLRPAGGVLADRFDRRLMIILGDTGSAAGILFLLVSFINGDPALWKIYSGVTVTSAFTAIQNPAYKASLTDMLTEQQFSRGSGLIQLASSAQHLISPALAGLLLAVSNVKTIMIIDLLTFITAVISVMVIKKKMLPSVKPLKQNFFNDMRKGWNALTSKSGVFILIMIISLVTFFVGFLQTLFAPMMLSITDSPTLGISQSTAASGMLLSSLVLGIFAVTKNYRKMLVTGLVLAGFFFAMIGVTDNILFITGSAFFFFCALPFINTSADVLVRKNIPNEMLGRAWGIIGVLSQGGFIAAYITAGFLADHVFNPLFNKGGALASTAGRIIGTGPGRGIGFMFIISGICVVITALITSQIKSLHSLETKVISPLYNEEQKIC